MEGVSKISTVVRKWLRDLRLERGYNQKFVADALETTVQQYSFMERGERRKDLPLSIMTKLSEIFSVSLEQICEWENNNGTTHI